MSRKTTQPLATPVPIGLSARTWRNPLLCSKQPRTRGSNKKGAGCCSDSENGDFLQSIIQTPAELAVVQEVARKSRADKLTMTDIEAEIAAVRQSRTPKAA